MVSQFISSINFQLEAVRKARHELKKRAMYKNTKTFAWRIKSKTVAKKLESLMNGGMVIFK
jgi:hypothetical protein